MCRSSSALEISENVSSSQYLAVARKIIKNGQNIRYTKTTFGAVFSQCGRIVCVAQSLNCLFLPRLLDDNPFKNTTMMLLHEPLVPTLI